MAFETQADPGPVLREVTDPRALRALAHPVRLRLIEELSIDGPLTATEVAERVGESPSACSFHLRQLARFGFVEEAGGGKGRSRPWRMTFIGWRFDEAAQSPSARVAAAAVSGLVRERRLALYRDWLDRRSVFPPAWQEAGIDDEYGFWLTPEELRGLREELQTLLVSRYRDRLTDPARRPAGSVMVELLTLGFPVRTPTEGAGS